MRGFVTERDFDAAERSFPGIVVFYLSLGHKPRTFLELVFAFLQTQKIQRAA